MATILDWLGRVINALSLSETFAGADDFRGRSVVSEHPANGMRPERLARILQAAETGDPEAFFELAEDIEERDLHYMSVLNTRKRSVAQLPITVKSASDATDHKTHAAYVQSWIDDGILRASLYDMLDGVGKGLSFLENDWQYRMGKTLPRELIWRPQRWFTFDRTDGETPLLREGVSNVPLPAHKFVVHRHKSKSGLTVRSGIARPVAWAWMLKSFTIRDWQIFMQNYGQPIRIGRYGRGATEAEKEVIRRAVFNVAGDCAALIPAGMDIEFKEVAAKGDAAELFRGGADWWNMQISKVVLGQTTTTEAISGGHAVSQEHRLVQEDIERDDAGMVTTTINAQLIPNIVAFQFGPQDLYPHVRVGRPDEVPLDIFAGAFDKIAKHGLTAPASYLRDRLGIPAPKDGDELVGGRPATPEPADPGADVPPGPLPGKGKANDKVATRHALDRLFASAHAARPDPDEIVDRLTAKMEVEAADALDGMIGEVRTVLMRARDLKDAAERLAKLDLSPDALSDAMARGMMLAHLAGQASLLDDLKGRS